jgi:hypothetical protein
VPIELSVGWGAAGVVAYLVWGVGDPGLAVRAETVGGRVRLRSRNVPGVPSPGARTRVRGTAAALGRAAVYALLIGPC